MPELYTYTAQKAADDVRILMSDQAGIRFRDAVIIGWINDVQRDIGLQTEFLQRSVSTTLAAGQASYDLQILLASKRMVTFGSIMAYGQKVELIGNADYLRRIEQNDTPQRSTGQPQYASEFDDQLTLWPVPNASAANALVIYGTALPQDIAAVDDPLTIPDRLYNALLRGVMARALEFDERAEEAAQSIAQRDAEIVRERGRANRNPDDQNLTIDWSYENDYS